MNNEEAQAKSALAVRAQLSLNDMFDAMGNLTAYVIVLRLHGYQHPLDEALRALRGMAIIAYCRPFKRSSAGAIAARFVTLEQLGIELPPDLLQLHEQLIRLRDKFLAHSDMEVLNYQRAPGNGNGSQTKSLWPQIDAIDPQQLERLVGRVLSACGTLADTLIKELSAAGRW
jgi:hypothetical protein